jgi:hypothetical protein
MKTKKLKNGAYKQVVIGGIKFKEINFKNLTTKDQTHYTKRLTNVARQGFNAPIEETDVYNHLIKPDKLMLALYKNKIVGFGGFSYIDNMLFGEGTVILPDFQGYGIATELLIKAGLHAHDFVGVRTQSPLAYRQLEKACTKLYPNESEEIPKYVLNLAKKIVKKYDDGILKNNLVMSTQYSGPLYSELPKHSKISELFEKIGLNANAGEMLVVIGKTIKHTGLDEKLIRSKKVK